MAQGTCSVVGCGKDARALGMCIMHWTRWRKWGTTDRRDPWPQERREMMSRKMKDNLRAKGNVLNRPSVAETYSAVHRRVGRELPAECAHCGTEKGLQSALRHGVPSERLRIELPGRNGAGLPYSLHTEDYLRLCHPCHLAYDGNGHGKRHSCELTVDRLLGHMEDWPARFDARSREAVEIVCQALRDIADGAVEE